MKPVYLLSAFLLLLAFLAAAGCTGASDRAPAPVVWILYGSEKGDLAYTDAAYSGLVAAQKDRSIRYREFTPKDADALPALLSDAAGEEKPGLVITVGFQYADLTRALAADHPDIRFLGIDQAGAGAGNYLVYEITSYGDSYLSGVLAASASKSGRAGIIMGMKTDLLDTFIRGYTDGARAVNSSFIVDHAYVHEDSVNGFTDPGQADSLAETMYRNGADVIFVGAGYSNTGVFAAANRSAGRYVIGTDSDQSPYGPGFVVASAVKRVDRVVYTGIGDYLDGKFEGGNRIAGLGDGATGIVFNPAFASWNQTAGAWEDRAREQEREYLSSRTLI